MGNPEKVRNIGIVLGVLIATMAASFFSNPASSEDWRHRVDNADGWGGMRHARTGNAPMRVTSRLFSNNDDCATAKLDVWLERGVLTYTLFNPGNPRPAHAADFFDEPGSITMLIGEQNCRVRVRIERADGASGQ